MMEVSEFVIIKWLQTAFLYSSMSFSVCGFWVSACALCCLAVFTVCGGHTALFGPEEWWNDSSQQEPLVSPCLCVCVCVCPCVCVCVHACACVCA